MRKTVINALLLTLAAAFVACSSIDCPLNSRVMMTCRMGDGKLSSDTLTVSTTRMDDTDSVLVNRVCDIDSIMLPMSYVHECDSFYFDFKDKVTKTHVIDTVRVTKTNVPHFESVDCNPMLFHEITKVSHTTHRIASIETNNSHVTYNTQIANLIIRLKEDNE